MPRANTTSASGIETENARESFPYHEQSCLLLPRRRQDNLEAHSRPLLHVVHGQRPPPCSSCLILSKLLWGYRSTLGCSSVQRDGELIMKRIGVFLSVAILSFSLLVPPLVSATDTASGSTVTHHTTSHKKTKHHAKSGSHKHKASTSSSMTSKEPQ